MTDNDLNFVLCVKISAVVRFLFKESRIYNVLDVGFVSYHTSLLPHYKFN